MDLTATADPRRGLGALGERLAADHLLRAGYVLIECNWRSRYGELDIVAADGRALVFCEVKTRALDDPLPEDQVNGFKQHQITKAARYYLSRYGVPQPPSRFDVIAIVWPEGRAPEVRHTTDAFDATF